MIRDIKRILEILSIFAENNRIHSKKYTKKHKNKKNFKCSYSVWSVLLMLFDVKKKHDQKAKNHEYNAKIYCQKNDCSRSHGVIIVIFVNCTTLKFLLFS